MQISHLLTRSRRTSGRGLSEFESAEIYRFRRSTRSPKFGVIKFERASFTAQTQSFLKLWQIRRGGHKHQIISRLFKKRFPHLKCNFQNEDYSDIS